MLCPDPDLYTRTYIQFAQVIKKVIIGFTEANHQVGLALMSSR